ncbi:hypothetical protein DAPPUDRAFT_259912 [Daphnia pulex]|uniref:Uncharacterized protein n=1 Tax=Daphnia pulex TaxID=6669 RepID=E9HI45_DAPPU|nr:hypothetical protein DAPPUDRAFT_259912 [Daphnia pulex]|eukprot:EFX68593.1 hypothetical protein DAPPUDRAFT_259912 [Daphnia pulex]
MGEQLAIRLVAVSQSVGPGGAGNQGEQQQLNKPMRVQCIGATLARHCRQEQSQTNRTEVKVFSWDVSKIQSCHWGSAMRVVTFLCRTSES